MRRSSSKVASAGAFVLVVLFFAGAGAGRAEVGRPQGARLTPALAALGAHAGPNQSLHVIVAGNGAVAALAGCGHVRHKLPFSTGVAGTVRASDLQLLAGQPEVSSVSIDSGVRFDATGSVSAASLSTLYPGRDSASNPWSAGMTGRGVGIAVIDSGVTPSPDFGTRLTQVRLDGESGSLDDTVGHGTMVAGVAAGYSPDGKFIGIAPGANVYAINIDPLRASIRVTSSLLSSGCSTTPTPTTSASSTSR
jgi:subtilisin family serine protease